MLNWVRGKVSGNKNRLKESHYDLDLSYIGKRIIAMGYPAQGFESLYRNDFQSVRDFLDERHGDNYMVYNLCSEKCYDKACFDGRVDRYPFDDHNPPPFDLIRQFCIHASDWLQEDEKHIVVVHCKAGKGRTGTMICSLMLHDGTVPNTMAALHEYGAARTKDEKGVTIPSQRRYIYYYEQFLNSGLPRDVEFHPSPCIITCLEFKGIPSQFFTRSLVIKITMMDDTVVYDSSDKELLPTKDHNGNRLVFDIASKPCPPITGDFRIAAYKGKKAAWYMWFNSEYIKPQEEFARFDVDKAAKSKKFTDAFTMTVSSARP